MFELRRAREPVILARDFYTLLGWYETVMGFRRVQLVDGGYRYAIVEGPGGIRIGLGEAEPMGVTAPDAANGTVRLQWEVHDLAGFMSWFAEESGTIAFGPNRDAADGFLYGAIRDPEGNEIWLVDEHCP